MSSTLLIIVLSLFGLGVALFYMKKVTSIPLDMGLNKEEGDKLERLQFSFGGGF